MSYALRTTGYPLLGLHSLAIVMPCKCSHHGAWPAASPAWCRCCPIWWTSRVTSGWWPPAERRELARIKALWDYLRRVTELNQDFLMGQSAEIQWVP